MSDHTPQEPTIRSSTSFRLAIGFGAVLAVCGFALLVNIYNLEKLKRASEAVRVRQQIRARTLKVVQTGDRMYRRWAAGGQIDPGRLEALKRTCSQLTRTLQAVAIPHVTDLEWTSLNRLTLTTQHLHSVFRAAATTEDPAKLQRLQERGGMLVQRLIRSDTRIGGHFDSKTYDLEAQAEWSWRVALLVTRAILGVALTVSLLLVYLTHRSIVGPIRTMVEGTRKLGSGELTSRIEVPESGEFRVLARSFNRMAEEIENRQKQLVEAEKLATLGRFSAGTAHEINNPITVILGYAKTMKSRLPEGSSDRKALQAIEEEARHCKVIVQELLDISRPPAEETGEVINPLQVTEDVMSVARVLQLTQEVEVRLDVPDRSLPLPIPRTRLRQVILNLVTNALEALQETHDGHLRVEGYVREGPESSDGRILAPPDAGRHYLVMRFIDNGPGMPPEEVERLFEPFFTTKPRGIGLGLTVAYSIVDRHGAHIDATSEVGKGTTFALNIPVEEDGQ